MAGFLVTLVRGAELEPARTLPGPRDFKSINYWRYQQSTCRKVLYQRGLPAGASVLSASLAL